MATKALIENLKKSEIGQIYWANVCMQYELGLLNTDKSKQIFSQAANDKDFTDTLTYIRKYGVGDASKAALAALIKQSEHNTMAIDACVKVINDTQLPEKLSTVMSTKIFAEHCLSSEGRFALTAEWIQRMTLTGSQPSSPIDSAHLVLQHFYNDGARDQTDIPGFDKFLLPKIQIRTRNLRFWMAGDPKDMPKNADDVRDFLGIAYLNPGDSLVRISLSKATLTRYDNLTIRRPSAFCVNDIVAPRFRGRHSSDSSAPPVTHEYGMTANLKGEMSPSEGTKEWICPSITVDAKDIIDVELLGPVKNLRTVPDNNQFAKHLSVFGAITGKIEKSVIKGICTP